MIVIYYLNLPVWLGEHTILGGFMKRALFYLSVFLILVISSPLPEAQARRREASVDRNELVDLYKKTDTQIQTLKSLAKTDPKIDQLAHLGAVYYWKMLHTIDLFDLWLTTRDKNDRATAFKFFSRMAADLSDFSVDTHKLLVLQRIFLANQKAKNTVLLMEQNANAIVHLLKGYDVDYRYSPNNKIYLPANTPKTLKLNDQVNRLLTGIDKLRALVKNVPQAAVGLRAIRIYTLQAYHAKILLDLWGRLKNEKENAFKFLGPAVLEATGTFDRVYISFGLWASKLKNEDLKTTGNDLEDSIYQINSVLRPYEAIYAKKDAKAATIVKNRNVARKAKGILSEGEYSYSKGYLAEAKKHYYSAHTHYKAAILQFKKAITLRPGYGRAFYYLALSHWAVGNQKRAIATLNEFLEKTPKKTLNAQDRSYIDQAIEKRKTLLATTPSAILTTVVKNLRQSAVNMAKRKRTDLSIKIEQEVMTIAAEVLGPQNVEMARSLVNLGMYHYRARQDDAAAKSMKDGIRTYEDVLDKRDPELSVAYVTAAILFSRLGQQKTMLKYYEKSLVAHQNLVSDLSLSQKKQFRQSIIKRGTGKDYFDSVNALVDVYLKAQDHKKTIRVLEHAGSYGESFLDENQYFYLRDILADGYSKIGQFEKTEVLLIDMLNRATKNRAFDHIEKISQKLQTMYVKTGLSQDEASAMVKRLRQK